MKTPTVDPSNFKSVRRANYFARIILCNVNITSVGDESDGNSTQSVVSLLAESEHIEGSESSRGINQKMEGSLASSKNVRGCGAREVHKNSTANDPSD